MTIDSYVYGEGVVKNGILTVTYEDSKAASYVNEDMDVIIGEISVPIDSIGKNNKGETFTISHTDFPDGEYAAKASFKQVKMISMLLN